MKCKKCGKEIPDGSAFCEFCGSEQATHGKSKTTAGILAILGLDGIGIQYFYCRKPLYGIVCILFCWTYITWIWSVIHGILLLTRDEDQFNKYMEDKNALL